MPAQILLDAVDQQIHRLLVRFLFDLALDLLETSLNLAAMVLEDASKLAAPGFERPHQQALALRPVKGRSGLRFIHGVFSLSWSWVDQHLLGRADDDVAPGAVQDHPAARRVPGLDSLPGRVDDQHLTGLVPQPDPLRSGGGINQHFLRASQTPQMHLLPPLGGVEQNLLPARAGLVRGLDVDFLAVLPRFQPQELTAEIGDLDPRALVLDVRGDIKLISLLRIAGPAAKRVAGLHVPLDRSVHVEDLPGAVDDLQELLLVAVVDDDGVPGLGLQQHLAPGAIVGRMAVVLLVLEIIAAVRLVLDLVLAVVTSGLTAEALGFGGLLARIAPGQPDAGPDRILNLTALELGPHRRPLLGNEKHPRILVAAVGKARPGPIGPVLPALTEHGRDLQPASAEALGVVVVTDKGAVLAVPAVLVARLVLPILGLDHSSSYLLPGRKESAQDLPCHPSGHRRGLLLRVDLRDGVVQCVLDGRIEMRLPSGDLSFDLFVVHPLDGLDYRIERRRLGAAPGRQFENRHKRHEQGRKELLVVENEGQSLFKLLHGRLLWLVSLPPVWRQGLCPAGRIFCPVVPNGHTRPARPRE